MPQKVANSIDVPESGVLPEVWYDWLRGYVSLYAGRTLHYAFGPPKRSSKANRYYWAYLNEIAHTANEAGNYSLYVDQGGELVVVPITSERLHFYFKSKYLPVSTYELNGHSFTLRPTTTRLNSTEFSEYIECIRNDEFVLQLGVYFEPVPDLSSYTLEDPV